MVRLFHLELNLDRSRDPGHSAVPSPAASSFIEQTSPLAANPLLVVDFLQFLV